MKGYEPRFGDVIFMRSYGIMSWLIRLLISVRYGLPLRYAWSHVQLVTGPNEAVSAEGSGVELIPVRGDKATIRSDAVVYRFKEPIGQASEDSMRAAIGTIIGKSYGYARYAIDFLRVMFFYLILLGMIPAAIFYKVTWPYFIGAVAGFVVIERLAKVFDMKGFDCVEVVSVVLAAGALWAPVGYHARSEFPDGMLQVLRNLAIHGAVDEVAVKQAGVDF